MKRPVEGTNYEDVEALQRAICLEYDCEFVPVSPDSILGFAASTAGMLPLNGLRHPTEEDTNGWYIWGGEELSQRSDFFSPFHTHHMIEKCPEVLKFLGLPPGFRFILAPGYVDVWYDSKLVEI